MLVTVGGPGCVWRGPETCRVTDGRGGEDFSIWFCVRAQIWGWMSRV